MRNSAGCTGATPASSVNGTAYGTAYCSLDSRGTRVTRHTQVTMSSGDAVVTMSSAVCRAGSRGGPGGVQGRRSQAAEGKSSASAGEAPDGRFVINPGFPSNGFRLGAKGPPRRSPAGRARAGRGGNLPGAVPLSRTAVLMRWRRPSPTGSVVGSRRANARPSGPGQRAIRPAPRGAAGWTPA